MVRSGVDIIEVDRIDKAILEYGVRFFERFFTPQELIDANGRTTALAARFAAKEAVAKALGTGIGEVGWRDIEIVKGARAEPMLRLHGRASEVAHEMGLVEWSISMSDTHEHAVAVAVALGEANLRGRR
jgi:holo-[acyl-carrier protein] synthase